MSNRDSGAKAIRVKLKNEFQKVLWAQYLLRYNLKRREKGKVEVYFQQYMDALRTYGKYVGTHLYLPIERGGIAGDIDQILSILAQGTDLYQRLATFNLMYREFPNQIYTDGLAELEAIEQELLKLSKLESTVLVDLAGSALPDSRL